MYMGERMNQSEQQLVEDSHLDILSRILRRFTFNSLFFFSGNVSVPLKFKFEF